MDHMQATARERLLESHFNQFLAVNAPVDEQYDGETSDMEASVPPFPDWMRQQIPQNLGTPTGTKSSPGSF
jgi:hypothetical protein